MSSAEIILSLIPALIQVESGGNERAFNKREDSAGVLQIQRVVVTDVNRIYGTHYTYHDRFDKDKSREICLKYLQHYGTEKRLGHKPTQQDFARIWNSGPNGWRKDSSLKYWVKVRPLIK